MQQHVFHDKSVLSLPVELNLPIFLKIFLILPDQALIFHELIFVIKNKYVYTYSFMKRVEETKNLTISDNNTVVVGL